MGRPEKLERVTLRQFVRDAVISGNYRILGHARERCDQRQVLAPHIERVLLHGRDVPARDRYDDVTTNWSYCYEGAIDDCGRLRVIVAIDGVLLVVTVVRLDGPEV